MVYELDELTFNESIKSCISYIKENWNPDGGCPRDYPGGVSNSWSTATLVYTLLVVERKSSEQVEKGIKWLLNCQNMNGGVPFNPEDKDQPTHEVIVPSAFVMLAYHEYLKLHPDNNEIKIKFESVVNYILENGKESISKNKKKMYSWSFQPRKDEKSSTIATAIIMRSLHRVLPYFEENIHIQEIIDGAKNWLLFAFKSNNKWGINPADNEQKELPTAYAILALFECGYNSREIKKGISFLKSKQNEDGSWDDHIEYLNSDDFGLGVGEVVFYYSTPHIIEAIFLVEIKKLDHKKIKAISWLSGEMKSGHVVSKHNPSVTIWPTRDCILSAYKIFSLFIPSWLEEISDELKEIKYRNFELETKNSELEEDIKKLVETKIKKKYNDTINWLALLIFILFIFLTYNLILAVGDRIEDSNIPIIYLLGISIAGGINTIIWGYKIK